jgi:anthranilate synthase component 2
MKPSVLMIDNFDSFTFNLVESFQRLGCVVKVLRNDADPHEALSMAIGARSLIALSPGPGKPSDAGCCLELVALARARVPLLGICLGHQAIVEEAGGRVVRAPMPVHGKATRLEHDGSGPFRGLPSPLHVGRYHSLCTRDVPRRFRVHAAIDGMAMAISDLEALQTGLQFHPESVLTRGGDAMLGNILGEAQAHWHQLSPPAAEQKTGLVDAAHS